MRALRYADNVQSSHVVTSSTLLSAHLLGKLVKSEVVEATLGGSSNPVALPPALQESMEVFQTTSLSTVTWQPGNVVQQGAQVLMGKTAATDAADIWNFEFVTNSDGFVIGLQPRTTWAVGAVIYIRYTAAS